MLDVLFGMLLEGCVSVLLPDALSELLLFEGGCGFGGFLVGLWF